MGIRPLDQIRPNMLKEGLLYSVCPWVRRPKPSYDDLALQEIPHSGAWLAAFTSFAVWFSL